VPVTAITDEDTRQDHALKRELNLTWASKLEANNKVTAGHWWRNTDRGRLLISVEQELAKRLGIGLGDSLSFRIGDQSISARVASLRSVQWDSFQPNFFIIFPPGVLDKYPSSYISSFYLPAAKKVFLNTLVKQHPGVTVIELDAIMNQLKIILTQVTIAVEYVMLFVLLAPCCWRHCRPAWTNACTTPPSCAPWVQEKITFVKPYWRSSACWACWPVSSPCLAANWAPG